MLRQLDEGMWVAGQIAPVDMATLKARGLSAIINNRPDSEEPGQPTSAEIEAAAATAGLAYAHIPIGGGFSADQVEAMASILDQAGGTLAFCRSGTRSTLLWALARARLGDDPLELEAKADAAGYSLAPIARWLQAH